MGSLSNILPVMGVLILILLAVWKSSVLKLGAQMRDRYHADSGIELAEDLVNES